MNTFNIIYGHLFSCRLLSPLSLALALGLGCCCGSLLQAQPAAPTTTGKASESREVSFPALDEYEKRGNVLQIREKMLFEINVRGERQTKLEQIQRAFQGARQEKDGDQQLLQLIKLRRQVLEVLDELADTNARQVEVAALLDSASAAVGLLPQVSTYLQDMRRQLLDMGIQQKAADKLLRQRLQNIKTSMQNVPPPATFTSKTGLKMRLIRSNKEMFYVSQPIPQASFKALQSMTATHQPENAAAATENDDVTPAKVTTAGQRGATEQQSVADATNGKVSLFEAVNFARWLSEQEASNYRLPEVTEIVILQRNNFVPETAIWTITPWQPLENLEYGRMCERFGVKLYHVWDPNHLLAKQEAFFGELPQARYQQLGFVVITPAQTGWQERWQRVNAML